MNSFDKCPICDIDLVSPKLIDDYKNSAWNKGCPSSHCFYRLANDNVSLYSLRLKFDDYAVYWF